MKFIKRDNRLKKFLQKGHPIISDILVASTSYTFGSYAGLLGVLGGSFLASTISATFSDLLERSLSSKEKQRISATIIISAKDILDKIEKGEKIREDWAGNNKNSNKIQEIIEETLVKAKNETEIKKIKFISSILTNSFFDKSLSFSQIEYLLNEVDHFSYQKIGLISIAKNVGKHDIAKDEISPGSYVTTEKLVILNELFDLFKKGFLILQEHNEKKHSIVLELNQINFTKIKLSTLGHYVYKNMNLSEYDEVDKNKIIKQYNFIPTLSGK